MSKRKGKLVYSTRSGDQRKSDSEPVGPSQSLPPAQQDLKIMRQTKGRKGKTVTVITGFVLTVDDLKATAKTLKTVCGSGGTAKNEADGQSIEIQGDHRDKIADQLKSLGYKVKFAGG